MGLLYASQWWTKTQNESYDKAQKEAELKRKIDEGKMVRVWKGKKR